MDHFLTVYQTRIRDAVLFGAKSENVNLLCVIGRALDSPFEYERVQNAIFDEVRSADVQGVIVLGTTLSIYANKDRVDELCRQFSMPVCNIGVQLSTVPSIILNNRRFEVVVEHLISQHNRRKIAFIGGPSVNEEAEIRREAFLAGMKACGVPFDPRLEKVGTYTPQSGFEAASALLEEKLPFDALVVANDNMAVGAASVLKSRGIRIPEDVCITGFDDTMVARFHNPPLTTMRQPLEMMGRFALDSVLCQLAGETVPLITEVDPLLYCRQSCGCNPAQTYRLFGSAEITVPIAEAFPQQRNKLAQKLESSVQIPKDLFDDWIERVLSAMEQEINGQSGQLLHLLEEILDSGGRRRWLVDELQSVISLLRGHFFYTKNSENDLEGLWYAAQMALSDASFKEQMSRQVDADLVSRVFLQREAAELPETLTRDALVEIIAREFEWIGIANAVITVYPDEQSDSSPIIIAVKNGRSVDTVDIGDDARELLPSLLLSDTPKSFVVVPLSVGGDRFGRMLLELGAPDLYYEMLRGHLSSYLKNVVTHRRRIEELRAAAEAHRQAIELLHRQKLESLGFLTGGIANDFNNMLSVIMGNLDVTLLELGDTAPLHDVVLECKAVAKHAAKLCSQLSEYSDQGDAAVKRLNVNRLIRNLEDLLMLSVLKGGKLMFDLQDGLPDIEGDAGRLSQVFVNLVINASKAMETEGGTIRIVTAFGYRNSEDFIPAEDDFRPEAGEYVTVKIANAASRRLRSSGDKEFIPSDAAEFDVKDPGAAAMLAIVQNHKGRIHVERRAGKEVCFEILFPSLQRKSDAPIHSSVPPTIQGKGALLLVDTEPGILRMGERLLKRIGFSVMLAKNSRQAVNLLETSGDDIQCVILDAAILDDVEAAVMEQIRKTRPNVPVIVSSGRAEPPSAESPLLEFAAFLKKPYDFEQLSSVLSKALKSSATDS
jgi:DNA-binding LacI/PurR family transcriptional regulator/signal transduction histidine kinase/ActR/RegA family two-component response regulator